MPQESEKTHSKFDRDWGWDLRLFLSADIVGSTAYKARTQRDEGPEWAHAFGEFFHEFPPFVEARYDESKTKCPCDEKVSPWKFSGDEVLFHVSLKSHREVVAHVSAFKDAVSAYPKSWQDKGIPLGLKATAWLAGFPVTNRKVQIPGMNTPDFIGPSIDLGFRLTRFADARRLVVSADLALMLLDAINSLELGSEFMHIHLEAREPLKGVIDGKPYPIVWVDVRDGATDREEKLLGIHQVNDHATMADYLREFIGGTAKLMRPFISGDVDPKYGNIPEKMERLRHEMIPEESYRDYLTHGVEEVTPPATEDEPPPDPSIFHS